MSISAAELIQFLSANMPTADTGTTGGAISTTGRPSLVQFSATANAFLISDGADVRTVDLTYRLASGVSGTVTVTLTGAVEVDSGIACERILRAVASGTSGSRTISVKQGSGGTVRATIPPNELTSTALFLNAASSPSGATVRYEKTFWKNTNGGSLALLDATVTLTADPLSKVTMGLDTSVDASTSAANRLTAPAGVSFVDDNVAQAVPGTNLAAGSAIGTWAKLSLAQDDTPAKSTFTTALAGNTI